MKQHNTIIMAAIAAALTFSFSSCEDDESSTAAAVNLSSISLEDITVEIGESKSIAITYTPESADIKQCAWTTSDEGVVTIDGFGKIKPVKVGTATITATSVKFQTITATCKVTVKPAVLRFNLNDGKGTLPADVTLNQDTVEIKLPAGNDLTKDTCDFLGWSAKKNGEVLKEFKATKTDTLWAVWNRREWADLGLTSKTLWAYDNLDGKFAWGEIESKKEFDWKNYALDTCIIDTIKNGTVAVTYNSRYFLREFCNKSEYAKDGKADNLDKLDDKHDAAFNDPKWKKNWATPTTEQFQELIEQCYWVWTDGYNKSKNKGFIVYKAKDDADKGKIGGTPTASYTSMATETSDNKKVPADVHIFLPVGNYWSSNLNTTDPYRAFGLSIESKDNAQQVKTFDEERFNGLLIRPVKK